MIKRVTNQIKKKSDSSINKSVDMSESHEISKLKRDVITLKAEMKARSDKIEKNDEKMKDIRTNIIRNLQQSLSDPLFETSSMALLVTQLSMTLTNMILESVEWQDLNLRLCSKNCL